MEAFCLICVTPHKIWCDFLVNFAKYKIFIIVDNNNYDLTEFKIRYANITFLQISENDCAVNGYIDSSFTIKKLISGWDKALYYFGVENKSFEYIWFAEEDVLIHSENTLINIDNKYVDDDLLSNNYEVNLTGEKKGWLWHIVSVNFEPPHYHGMMCVVRFSNRMMRCIDEYARKNKKLEFIEALFPTTAIKNNLKYSTPDEFKNITWNHNYTNETKIRSNLYHPVKNIEEHILFRK